VALATVFVSSSGAGCPAPAPVCTLTAVPSTISATQSSTLTAICTNSPTSYTWTNDPNGPPFAGTGGTNVFFTARATPYNYSVTATNCAGTSPPATASVTVNAAAPPSTVPLNIGGTVDPTASLTISSPQITSPFFAAGNFCLLNLFLGTCPTQQVPANSWITLTFNFPLASVSNPVQVGGLMLTDSSSFTTIIWNGAVGTSVSASVFTGNGLSLGVYATQCLAPGPCF